MVLVMRMKLTEFWVVVGLLRFTLLKELKVSNRN